MDPLHASTSVTVQPPWAHHPVILQMEPPFQRRLHLVMIATPLTTIKSIVASCVTLTQPFLLSGRKVDAVIGDIIHTRRLTFLEPLPTVRAEFHKEFQEQASDILTPRGRYFVVDLPTHKSRVTLSR